MRKRNPYVCVHVLCKVFFVDIRSGGVVLETEGSVTDLDRQTKLEIQQAGLANVLDLGARLADFCLLETHAHTGAPAEHCEGTCAHFTFLCLRLFGLNNSRNERVV